MPMLSIRHVLLLVVASVILTVASPVSGFAASRQIAAPAGVLLGDSATETQPDSLNAGRLRAFRLRAHASGLAAKVRLYIDSQSSAKAVLVGIYRNGDEGPGSLLDTGRIASPREGSWNSLPFVLHELLSGHTYWLAVLAEGGTLRYRTRPGGRCRSETSLGRHLRALPRSWGSGALSLRARCPISAYALAVTAGLPRPRVAPAAPTLVPGSPSLIAPSSPLGSPAPGEESPPPPDEESPPPPPVAPTNLALPVITGAIAVGSTLSASNGSWTGSPSGYSYQWEDCDGAGAHCTTITGASAATDKITSGEVGHRVRVVVTASNEAGATAASSQASALIAESPPPPPANTALPTIAGTPKQGSTLTASKGAWSGGPTSYSYQWQDCGGAGGNCSNVGAASTTYKLGASDVGHTIRVVVTAGNTGGSTSATSNATAVVAAIPPPPPTPPVNTALPVVGGTVAVEGTLTASRGTWSGSPTGYAYQWQDCDSSGNNCAAIGGASANTHKLTAGEVGHTVRVVVTATNSGGSTPASSAHTSVIPGASGGLFISPAGNDSNACTEALPCQTMNRAYHLATPGQSVQMLAGSYPGQAINSDSSKTSSSDVVFMPAEGASVQVTGTIYVFASHVTIENITVQDVTMGNYDQTAGRPDPTDITLQNLTGRNFEIDSTTNVTIEGGSWGPASACGGPNGGNNDSIRQPTSTAPANILIDNTVIHDVQSYNLVECHIEGLAIFAGTNVTVSNSKFYGNSVYDVFMQANSGGHPNNITLSNNWFATTVDNSGANGQPVGSGNGIALGNELSANVTIDSNHFNDALNLNDAGDISKFTNVHVHGNVGIMPYSNYPCGSLSGIEWSENIWQNDKCASTDIDLNGAAMPYKKATNDATLDYTLTGPYANWPESAEEGEEEPPKEEPPVEGGVASVFVSPSGSDSASCSQVAPCRSLARAYGVAASGATVQLANGTYSDTTLPVDSSKGSSNVVFTAAPGATPTFSSTLHVQARHVELSGLKFATLWVDATAQNDVLRNDTYKNFEVISSGAQAPTNISFIGGSAGPAADENNIIGSNGTSTTASPTNILIKGVHIHDYTLTPGSGAHVDCLQVWAANGLTVEGSTFNDCEVFDIFLQFLPGGSAGTPSNVTIQNNFLDCCRSGFYSIMLPYHTGATGGSHFTNVTIRNNSTNKAITADPDASYTNVKIDGNIGPSLVFYSNASGNLQGKPAGLSADYNVWYEGSKIGTHDQLAPSGFLEPNNVNFNLAPGAAALNHGDPEDYPPTDINGKTRPNPPDAGATQH